MKIDHYFDVCCCRCGSHRSTDFEKGLAESARYLRQVAVLEGWKEVKASHLPICPNCVRKSQAEN